MTSLERIGHPRLKVGWVISASLGIVKHRWRGIGLAVLIRWAIGLGYSSAYRLMHPAHIRHGVHDPAGLALEAANTLGFACLDLLETAVVVWLALRPARLPASIIEASKSAIRCFPALLPYQLVLSLPRLALELAQLWWIAGSVGHMVTLAAWSGAAEIIYSIAIIAAWGLYVPVVLGEQHGVLASFSRAWHLLSGSRWRLTSLFILTTVITVVPSLLWLLIFTLLVRHPFGVSSGPYFAVQIGALELFSLVADAFLLAMVAMSYRDLSRSRDGATLGDISDIFA